MKDFLNDGSVPYSEVMRFTKNCISHPRATELAYIERFISGEKDLTPGVHFSQANLQIIKTYNEIE